MVIDVPQGADKPYSLSRSIYVRVGQSTFKADPATAAEMVEVQATLPGRWEQDAVPGFVISDCDGRELMEARNELKRIGRLGTDVTEDDEELLRRLRLVRNGQYINAAVLLFASDPLAWSPNLAVRVVSYAICQLSERQSAFLAATKPGHAYKTSNYADITGVVARQAQRELGELLEWGFFERHGKGPATVYARTEKAS